MPGIWDAPADCAAIIRNIFDHLSPADGVEPASNRTLPGHPMWGAASATAACRTGATATRRGDGSVLISLGHLHQVISIAPDSGPVRWRLDGPGSAFTFADPRDRFYAPHTALPLANGNVLLFDNGTGRPYAEGSQYSRTVELELDLQDVGAPGMGILALAPLSRAAPACSACTTATP